MTVFNLNRYLQLQSSRDPWDIYIKTRNNIYLQETERPWLCIIQYTVYFWITSTETFKKMS